jgi:hypothetical protein
MISAKLMASSTPGMANAISCIMDPIIPFLSAERECIRVWRRCEWARGHGHSSTISWIALVGSPLRTEFLAKCVGEIVCWVGGLRGVSESVSRARSVRLTMSRTDSRHFASCMASEQDVVV